MKKFVIAALSIVGVVVLAASPAFGTKPIKDKDDFHKVTICHNVEHNGHAVSVDVASVKGTQDTGHGFLTLDENLGFVSFVPHAGNGGHSEDFYLHNGAENKPEDDDACKGEDEVEEPPTTTTTTTVPPTTTTTQPEPPVTTTTVPVPAPVVPVVPSNPTPVTDPVPVVPVVDPTPVTVPEPVAPVVESVPTPVVPAPVAELPHTGAGSLTLALVGFALVAAGVVAKFLGKIPTFE